MRMKQRLERIKMFRKQPLRQYEAFIWMVYVRHRGIETKGLPFFLKRQAE